MSTTEYEAVPAIAGEATSRAGTVVMKFGGTSVGDPQKLKDVAARIVAAHGEGTRVVAVLSAMGDTTDELVRLAYEISPRPEPRELDMLISVGWVATPKTCWVCSGVPGASPLMMLLRVRSM